MSCREAKTVCPSDSRRAAAKSEFIPGFHTLGSTSSPPASLMATHSVSLALGPEQRREGIKEESSRQRVAVEIEVAKDTAQLPSSSSAAEVSPLEITPPLNLFQPQKSPTTELYSPYPP